MKKLSKEDFIKNAKLKHGEKYDYSKSVYENNKSIIIIGCPLHGDFLQKASMHMTGRGCRECKRITLSKINTSTSEYVIEKMKKINNDLYDYSLVEYKNFHKNVKIICKKHNHIFLQSPANHCHPFVGCDLCKSENAHYTLEEFVKKAKLKHGDKYDYSKVIYVSSVEKVEIICKKHGSFFQKPVAHLEGKGCFRCRQSKGEEKINYILINNKINFIRQKTFETLRSVKNKKLFIDFYLQDFNICIEYDGEQHYINKPRWNGKLGLEYTQLHDKIKNDYCKNNNIRLYRITYKDNIDEKMKEIIDSLSQYQTFCNSVETTS